MITAMKMVALGPALASQLYQSTEGPQSSERHLESQAVRLTPLSARRTITTTQLPQVTLILIYQAQEMEAPLN